jgi:hypothetical protein
MRTSVDFFKNNKSAIFHSRDITQLGTNTASSDFNIKESTALIN